MNYRHGFHAGNFADVHKHAVFARILVHLAEKPAAFRVLDTHAGSGLYDLDGPEAARTGEWREGIARLNAASLSPEAAALLEPYLAAVSAVRAAKGPAAYPGSPLLARALLRRQDRLIACEYEPQAAAALAQALAVDRRVKVVAIDGWTALSAYIPPKERRGMVLIDPPYEAVDEFERLPGRLAAACRKWPTGIFMLWYPIKDPAATSRLADRLTATGIPKILRSELVIGPAGAADAPRLHGSGLAIVNPPWRLADELAVMLPALAHLLARGGHVAQPGATRPDWLAGER